MTETLITAGGLTILLVELIKFVVKRVKNDPEYSLPTTFYVLFIPVSNALMPFVLVLLGVSVQDPVLAMPALEILRYVLRTLVSSMISLVGYNNGVKPLKEYNRQLKEKESII